MPSLHKTFLPVYALLLSTASAVDAVCYKLPSNCDGLVVMLNYLNDCNADATTYTEEYPCQPAPGAPQSEPTTTATTVAQVDPAATLFRTCSSGEIFRSSSECVNDYSCLATPWATRASWGGALHTSVPTFTYYETFSTTGRVTTVAHTTDDVGYCACENGQGGYYAACPPLPTA